MWKFFIIPNDVDYVEHDNFLVWEQTDHIDPLVPTVIFITDSITQNHKRFVVVYKGLMQTTGGSGSCYNPTRRRWYDRTDPMDNSKMPLHMSKWVLFNMNAIYRMVVTSKEDNLKKMGLLTYSTSYCTELYATHMYGILIGIIDAIGMGTLDVEILKNLPNKSYRRKMLTE